MAEDWRWINDRRIEFKLRERVKFHNRERFNAETAGARSLRMLLGALRSEGRKDDGHVGFLFLRSMGGFSDEQKTNL